MLRQALENIASFFGRGNIGYTLAQIGIEDHENAANVINSLSHKDAYYYQSDLMPPAVEAVFRDVFAKLLEKYKFVEESNWHAHNIILGKLVDTGIAGTICFFIFYGLGFYYSLRAAKPESRWPAAFFAFYFLVGMMDDSLARLNDSFVIMLIGFAAALPQASGLSGQAQKNFTGVQ